jgi:hypothetical protein
MIITHYRKIVFAASFALAAGLAAQSAAAQGAKEPVTLKRTYKTGATEKYSNTTVMEMSAPGMPQQKITTSADLTMTYGKIEAGTAEVVSVTSNMKMDAPGTPLPPDLLPPESRTTGKIDAQNMMVTTFDPAAAGDNPLAGLAGGLAQGIAGDTPTPQGVAFPLKPVAPGDKWKTTMSAYESLGMTGDIENTFVGETVFEGKPAYRITFEGHFKPSPAGGPAPTNPLAGLIGAMTMDITGEVMLDKTDCSILSATTNSTSNTSLSIGGQNMSMDQKTLVTQKRLK